MEMKSFKVMLQIVEETIMKTNETTVSNCLKNIFHSTAVNLKSNIIMFVVFKNISEIVCSLHPELVTNRREFFENNPPDTRCYFWTGYKIILMFSFRATLRSLGGSVR